MLRVARIPSRMTWGQADIVRNGNHTDLSGGLTVGGAVATGSQMSARDVAHHADPS